MDKHQWVATVKCLPGSRARLRDRLAPGNGGKTPRITHVDFGDFGISPVGAIVRGTHETDDKRRVHHDVSAKLSSMLGSMTATIEVCVTDAASEDTERAERFDTEESLAKKLGAADALVVVHTAGNSVMVPTKLQALASGGDGFKRAQTFLRASLSLDTPIVRIGITQLDSVPFVVETIDDDGTVQLGERNRATLEEVSFDVDDRHALTKWACDKLGIEPADLVRKGRTLHELSEAFMVWIDEVKGKAAITVYRPSELAQ
jgi:hypothetical protein